MVSGVLSAVDHKVSASRATQLVAVTEANLALAKRCFFGFLEPVHPGATWKGKSDRIFVWLAC